MTGETAIDAAIAAETASKSFLIAFYLDPHAPAAADHHFNDGLAAFRRAATALGFTLTPIKQEALHDVANTPTRDPDSGRPSLEEPAAPSGLTQNYGE